MLKSLSFRLDVLAASALFVAGAIPNSAFPQGSPTPSPSASGGASVTVISRTGPDGEYLSTADGKTLYVADTDTKDTPGCTGNCAKQYPLLALQPDQKCTGSGNVQASLLQTRQLPGTYQTEYSTDIACGATFVSITFPRKILQGVPFHLSINDHAPGDTTGKCAKVGNTTFYMIRPNGTVIPCGAPPTPTPPPAPAPAPPVYLPPTTSTSSCGSFNVCGWTPGWRCYDPYPYLSQCRPECCAFVGDSSCTGSNSCGGYSGGSSSCGPFNVCGWTPGWRCNYSVSDSNPPVGYRPECCYNAGDSSCPGYS
jgi:predicted lipoprotein with Yx(FWY)xxD motif